MTNCNTYDDDNKRLQEENDRLRKELDQSERARKAGEAFLRTEVKKQWVIPMQDGSLRSVTDAEIDRGLQDFASKLESGELDSMVDRGLGNRAKPVGAEGRFINYGRLIDNANIQSAEDYATLTEGLIGNWKEAAPEDFAFVTQVYDRDRLLRSVADAYREYTDADTIATSMANNVVGFMNLAEKMTRLRFLSDYSKNSYLKVLGEIGDWMDSTNAKVPSGLRQRAFSSYKLALMAERHVSAAKRNTGQALRSLQENFDAPDNFKVDMAEAQEVLGMTAKDVDADQHIAKVIEAIDSGNADAVRQLRIAGTADTLDPNSKLGKGWANTHMRFGNALVKDSQLTTLGSQVRANFLGTWLANTHGFVHQAFENIGNLTPIGTRFSREAIGEGLQVAWKSAAYSHDAVRRSWRELAADAFLRGDAPFGGNFDTYGAKVSNNDKLLADVRGIMNEPFLPGGPMRPQNWARTVHKIHAATRLLAYDKAPAHMKTEAILLPALRAMSATDSVLGYDAFLFKLKNDLEIKARRDGVQLGLLDQKTRDEWVQGQLDNAFYHAAPTEANVLAFRRQHKLKGGDISDDEIRQIITAERVKSTYELPTLDTPEAQAAMDYSMRNRMQSTPGEHADALARKIDEAMMAARQHWAVDSLVPYWRAPFNQFLFDTRLTFGPLGDTVKLLYSDNPTQEQIARVQAGWVMSGSLLGLFAGLDMMGLIEGNGPNNLDARRAWLLEGNKPNSIAGVPYLGGVPILNSMFLWKDTVEALRNARRSSFDQQEMFWGLVQVMTSQIIRQTGFGQIQRLADAMLDPAQKMPQLIGWLGQGQLPGSGVMRDLQRLTGHGSADLYKDRNPLGTEKFLAGEDDPFVKIERFLRDAAYTTVPLLGLPTGAPRKEQDFLGQPIQLEFGADWAEAMKSRFHPRIWPRANQRVYAELDAQGQLRLPQPLLARSLDGVAMSAELQKQYNDTFGTVKGVIPLSVRMGQAARAITVSITYETEDVLTGASQEKMQARYPGSGLTTVKARESESFQLAPFLDKHVKGKTIIEAFTSLFNDPVYKTMQDLGGTTSDLGVRDMPPSERRKQAASKMIEGIYAYYEQLTKDQLRASDTPAAKQWWAVYQRMEDQRNANEFDLKLPALKEALGNYQPAP